MSRIYTAVIGAREAGEELYWQAYEVGRLIAERGVIFASGGLGGVMEASHCGATEIGLSKKAGRGGVCVVWRVVFSWIC